MFDEADLSCLICTKRFNDDTRIPFFCNWEDCRKNYCGQCILDDFHKKGGKFECPGHCVHHAMKSELSIEFMKENDNICGDNWVLKNRELLDHLQNHPEDEADESTDEEVDKIKEAIGTSLKKLITEK